MIKNKNNIDCVIPAAGLSSRMGCWKLTLPYKDNTILEQSITNALSFCTRVILVVGHREDELIERFQDNTKVTIVRNQHYRSGMYSSLQLGINEVDTEFFYISMVICLVSKKKFIKLFGNIRLLARCSRVNHTQQATLC